MHVYDTLTLILIFLYSFEILSLTHSNHQNKGLFFIASCALMFFVLLIDYNNAYDMSDYLLTYHNMPSSMYGTPDNPSTPNEPGFSWLCKMLWILPRFDFVLIFVCKTLCFIPIIYGINNYSSFKIGSLILLITLPGIWLVEIITQRQALSIAFLLIALYIFINRSKFKLWFVWVVALFAIAISFHSTPLLMIPISLVLYYTPISKKLMYIVLILSCSLSKVFYDVFSQYFLLFFANSEDFERMVKYVDNQEELGIGKVNILYNMFYTLFAVFLVYYNEYKDKIQEFCLKSMVLAWSIYLLIGPLPNSDRSTGFFFCVGAIGAMPKRNLKSALILLLFLIAFSLQKHMGYIRQDFWSDSFIWD